MNTFLDINIFPSNGGFQGQGPLGLEGETPSSGPSILTNIISTAIGVMTIVAIIWFIFLLLSGALGIMSAQDDKNKVAAARARITSGLTGLLIIFSAVAVLSVIGWIFGIQNILNLNLIILNLINLV